MICRQRLRSQSHTLRRIPTTRNANPPSMCQQSCKRCSLCTREIIVYNNVTWSSVDVKPAGHSSQTVSLVVVHVTMILYPSGHGEQGVHAVSLDTAVMSNTKPSLH
eukprot:1380870-Rhodomonas_salina.3